MITYIHRSLHDRNKPLQHQKLLSTHGILNTKHINSVLTITEAQTDTLNIVHTNSLNKCNFLRYTQGTHELIQN